ncbi:hypothetical protein SAMN05443529_1416 [Desulfosporosinus hippei DSM 8344]|uniref:Uncharacterized protein n=1 Tax=Desulfosporosinus hippei DSM 8344 TaxID=1121419 RepID=A0A1G8KTH0_9FIRM|nr:hypothetical protein SAMN05443529_1416 [Desulfosporosinus hippei DSM 8344]
MYKTLSFIPGGQIVTSEGFSVVALKNLEL